jgi:hypothetical protein
MVAAGFQGTSTITQNYQIYQQLIVADNVIVDGKEILNHTKNPVKEKRPAPCIGVALF